MSYCPGTHPVFEYDCGRNAVYKPFVLTTGFLFHATIYHGPMGEHAGKALVVVFYGYVGAVLSPAVKEAFHPREVLTRSAVGLSWSAYNNTFNFLTRRIGSEEVVEFGCRYGGKSSCYNLSWVCYRQSRTLAAVIYGYNAHVFT